MAMKDVIVIGAGPAGVAASLRAAALGSATALVTRDVFGVEIAQIAAIAVASRTKVEDLAITPLSFPTYTNVLSRALFSAARQLNVEGPWEASQALEGENQAGIAQDWREASR
jgi:pyruvate/2-oxoglutarate dehydrogenase complex dihydrolipoamide dehydrogenase (E3) component